MKFERGEGYIDLCVSVLVFTLMLSTVLSVFSFYSLRLKMEQAASEVLELAGAKGKIRDEELASLIAELTREEEYSIELSAPLLFEEGSGKVQLGEKIIVTVRYKDGKTVQKSGFSRKYWRNGE